MKKFVFVVFFALGISASGIYGQTKNDDIVKMMRLSGSDKMAAQVFDAMMAQFKPMLPNANWAEIRKKANFDALLYDCVPIYAKYYTHDEIKQFIKFYESPLGRKMVETTPLIMSETMIIGQRWGEKLGQVMRDEMK